MGFRFSRRVKIAPGIRLNLGLRGVSLSAGVRGASVTLGKHGLHGNVGLPGTGLSYRTRLAGGPANRAGAGEAQARRRQMRAELELAVSESNVATLAALEVHLATPLPALGDDAAPGGPPRPQRPQTPDSRPGEPRPAVWVRYAEDLAAWRAGQANHDVRPPPEALARRAAALERRLASLDWPRETAAAFDISEDGRTIVLDVDLPEIEDLPSGEARVNGTTLEVEERPFTQARMRSLYARHVHAVLFRLVGEVFAALPGARRVVVAGYTQRIAKATGRLEDEYLLQVRVEREQWRLIDFTALDAVDPVAALERFELNRKLSARGVFSPVTPASL